MSGTYVAGIDIGTTSVCCVVADAAGGAVVHTETRANDARLPSSRRWEELQQPDRIARLVKEMIAACGQLWEQVAAIGISCQMHGMLYVDGAGEALGSLMTWQDRRGDERLPTGETYAGWLEAQTGYRVPAGYGLTTHLYNVRNEEVPAGAAALCAIGDYVAMKLCGARRPLIDASVAASLGLFSADALAFDRQALAAAGLDAALLPELAGGTRLVGRTADGKAVACAIGDNQASFLGAVPQLERTLLINVGTGAQVSVFAERPDNLAAIDPALDVRPFPGGGYLLVGATLGGGKAYALLEGFFRETCRLFAGTADDVSLYERMNRLAEEELGRALPGGPPLLRVRTQFYGTRGNPAATGAIDNIASDGFTPSRLIAGFLNGVVDELAAFVPLLPESLRRELAVGCGAGNGLRRNPALRRLLKQRLELPFHLSAVEEEAAFGAAIYAAAAGGLFPDIPAALAGMQAGCRFG
ncbi:sedoheptulokinase [Paenibacillus cymbidii]|uniref:sedoheptulokinase n=1 Tax=Paenibacillus cymbidii TaxID=1639034 RepID=UPI0010803C5C|nr:FGGY family carbohydrate kinase [Paenibacillus cymbidii]